MQEPKLAEGESNHSELDRINGYFSGPRHRFDGFGKSNDHSDYYNPKLHPESTFTRACVSVEWAAFSEFMQGGPNAPGMWYIPCGISSGLRAHEELDRKNRSNVDVPNYEPAVSTYKAEEVIGSERQHMLMVRNRDDNLRRAQIVGDTHPDNIVIAPVVREGAVRELTRTAAFSRWQKYEEEDFMAFWYPAIDKCKGMVLDGDWNYSRNSIWEMMRGVLVQSGQIPSRPKADMEVVDLDGKEITLLARAEKVAETLKYQLGKGFEPREAATALAQIFTLDDDIRAGTIPEGSLHNVLKRRLPSELNAMDSLKAEIEPVLLSHCGQYMRLDDLPERYRDAAENSKPLTKKQQDAFSLFAASIAEEQDRILSVLPSAELQVKHAQTNFPPRREFDSYERFFEKDAQAMMFEDRWYDKLPLWERVTLPFIVGATETGLYPASHPMATAIFTDLKRGKKGFAIAQRTGVHNLDEFAGSQGRAITEVTSANIADTETLKANLKAENPGQIVVNTLSFLRATDTVEHFRKQDPTHFVAAPGASETSPQMRLAFQMKYLDRNVGRAVFQEGWQYSNDLVQLRVRARLIQAGLVERPAGEQSPLTVYTTVDNKVLPKPDTLLNDITLLSEEVNRAVKHNVHATEQALALARLVTLHELLVDPTLRRSGQKQTRDIINTLKADTSLTCYDRKEAKEICDAAKELLKSKAALWIPYERLYATPSADDSPDRKSAKDVQNLRMKDYIDAQKRLKGEEAMASKRGSYGSGDIQIVRRGAQR